MTFCPLSFSPKSPPNSPNPELSTFDDQLRDVYINRCVVETSMHSPPSLKMMVAEDGDGGGQLAALSASDIIWDWSSKPNLPIK